MQGKAAGAAHSGTSAIPPNAALRRSPAERFEGADGRVARVVAGGMSLDTSCVVIGAGVRLPPSRLVLFEALVDAIHRAAPSAAIAFNTRPEDTGAAAVYDRAYTWLDEALRAPDPRGLAGIVAARSPELRFLPEAFDRLGRERAAVVPHHDRVADAKARDALANLGDRPRHLVADHVDRTQAGEAGAVADEHALAGIGVVSVVVGGVDVGAAVRVDRGDRAERRAREAPARPCGASPVRRPGRGWHNPCRIMVDGLQARPPGSVGPADGSCRTRCRRGEHVHFCAEREPTADRRFRFVGRTPNKRYDP